MLPITARRAALLIALALILPSLRARADIDTDLARRHFEKGTEFYQHEHYEDAIKEFKAARLAKPVAEMDYNIARCYDRLEQFDDAIREYQAYLDHGPIAEDVPKVERRIEKLRERQKLAAAEKEREAERAAGKTPSEVTPPPPPPKSIPEDDGLLVAHSYDERGHEEHARKRIWTWVLVAGAVALLAGGVTAELIARSRFDDAQGKGGCSPVCSDDQVGNITSPEYAGYGVFAAAGVAAVGAIVAFIIEGRPHEGATATPRVESGASSLIFHF